MNWRTIFVEVAGANVPQGGDARSQAGWLASDQARPERPELVMVQLQFVWSGWAPVAAVVKNVAGGRIPSGSLVVRALIRFVPPGAPQPVQRSYPGMA